MGSEEERRKVHSAQMMQEWHRGSRVGMKSSFFVFNPRNAWYMWNYTGLLYRVQRLSVLRYNNNKVEGLILTWRIVMTRKDPRTIKIRSPLLRTRKASRYTEEHLLLVRIFITSSTRWVFEGFKKVPILANYFPTPRSALQKSFPQVSKVFAIDLRPLMVFKSSNGQLVQCFEVFPSPTPAMLASGEHSQHYSERCFRPTNDKNV
ncbi:hypothetical protein BDP27DRAFT_1360380 [Rhodocollybia butyracea]|uniref:Uncharacterized protein n=1 Tax=Rhodocollybia butyracea TaxID=206335 RepID=A0A9P5Q153_9AGAR|nr:hypothetical protein BDP27DRAFT_1360380 [Rhodocollybia butyracea]